MLMKNCYTKYYIINDSRPQYKPLDNLCNLGTQCLMPAECFARLWADFLVGPRNTFFQVGTYILFQILCKSVMVSFFLFFCSSKKLPIVSKILPNVGKFCVNDIYISIIVNFSLLQYLSYNRKMQKDCKIFVKYKFYTQTF